MLAIGNSAVGPCTYCLTSAMQREIPFARSKGIDPDVYDVPFDDVSTFLDQTARDVIGAYEPRVAVDSVELEFGQVDSDDGTYYAVTISDADGLPGITEGGDM